MAHLGISIKDAKYIDIDVYVELINLVLETMSDDPPIRRATQKTLIYFYHRKGWVLMAETVKGINIKLSLDGKDLEHEIKKLIRI